MESESQYDDLITRYLLNEAGPEEEKFVREWMFAEEKNRLYVEALQNTLKLISLTRETEKVNVNKEWEQFRQVAFKEELGGEHFTQYDIPTWDEVREEEQSGRAKVFRIILGASIAASLIFMIGFSTGWFSSGVMPDNSIAQQKKAPKDGATIDPLMAVVQHEVNTSGKTRQIILPDGSKITLFDSSELTYKEPVDGKKRNVYLLGKADFKVAKNKTKPFTVFSEDISTTAIGTRFTVVTKNGDKTITVRLTEGKVVVRSLKGYNNNWTKAVYLLPGQELIYDKTKKAITILSFAKEKENSKYAIQPKENPSIPKYDKRSWFMFNNQSLGEIFDALTEMYDVKIVYSKKDVKDKYFIGTYDKNDSLEKILKQIALLNDLKITKQNDTFKIERQVLKKSR